MYHNRNLMRAVSVAALAAGFGATAARATSPEAGAIIGNQAVATYVNAAGDTITVTSNTVETVVQQVAGVSLTADNSEQIAPGGKAFLPHIVTNEGNGTDSYTLTAAEQGTGTLDTTQLVFYPDADMDGVADSATPLSQTPVLAPGEQFGVVVEATVASTASGTDTILIEAVSQLDGAITASNTDTLTVSNGAIVELVKRMVADPASGGNPNIVDAGDTVTIELTYSSTGLADADNYTVQDVLDGRLAYVDGSARWSDAAGVLDENNGSTATDATNGAGETIVYDHDDNQTVSFTLSSVGSGRSGSVTFQATITAAAGAGIIPNVATQDVDGTAFPPSNTASVTVDQQFAVAIADTRVAPDGSIDGAVASSTDDDAAADDVVTETGDVFQGGTVAHEFLVTNRSNDFDSLSLSVANVDYPAGTTFRFVGPDGITPIIGDVGPLAPGEARAVTLLATLPTNAPVTAAPAGFTATVTTTSSASGASDDSTAEFAGAVLAAAVDLENAVAGREGDGAAPTDAGSPWITTATDPGQAVTFPMLIENNGPTSDSYNLSLAQALPAGWTVEFRLADGTVVSNTGTIPAGGSQALTVVVTPPEGEVPGDTAIDIQVASSVSGQSDRIVNQVTVNPVHDLQIVDGQTAQAAPGGVVEMQHTVTNLGNVAISEGAITQTGLGNFSGAIFLDLDGDGEVDAGEPVIDNFDDLAAPLQPGDSISLVYRVQTPSTATPGVTELGTIAVATALNGGTGTDANTGDNANEDRITIVSGDVTLTKYQYVDAACNGTAGTFGKQQQPVEPGQCIRYRIDAANTGSAAADAVKISDAAPAYTQITDCGGSCAATVFPAGSTSTVTATAVASDHGTVLPGGFARLEFTVRVNP